MASGSGSAGAARKVPSLFERERRKLRFRFLVFHCRLGGGSGHGGCFMLPEIVALDPLVGDVTHPRVQCEMIMQGRFDGNTSELVQLLHPVFSHGRLKLLSVQETWCHFGNA